MFCLWIPQEKVWLVTEYELYMLESQEKLKLTDFTVATSVDAGGFLKVWLPILDFYSSYHFLKQQTGINSIQEWLTPNIFYLFE
jgi:hypothetical protein